MNVAQYYREQQGSRQWSSFLQAFAEELGSQIEVGDLRALMHQIGTRMAASWDFAKCESIDELQIAINERWHEMNWGWVDIVDQGDYIRLEHKEAPLTTAFGGASTVWAPALLESIYGQLFKLLGAGEDLTLRQYEQGTGNDILEFRLEKTK